jgi:hypothetical protein
MAVFPKANIPSWFFPLPIIISLLLLQVHNAYRIIRYIFFSTYPMNFDSNSIVIYLYGKKEGGFGRFGGK